MEKWSFMSRAVIPAALPLLAMIVLELIYYNSWRIDNYGLHQGIAFISGIILFAVIALAPAYTYSVAFFRGATQAERIIASLVTPLAWLIKELYRVSEFFTLGETFYYGLSSIFLLSLFGSLALMAICEMIGRQRLNKRGLRTGPVITAIPVAAIAADIVVALLFFAWGMGVHGFYIYMKGYRLLFL
ncbi:MAG: hypothetical protein PHY31_02205 [Smithellaceae bacterium]|nr:hypothetical protein [Smithellaceae bacterium]